MNRFTDPAAPGMRGRRDEMSLSKQYIAFGSWRCNCTVIARTLDDIPTHCPTHAEYLLGPATWESNPHHVDFGITPDHRKATS